MSTALFNEVRLRPLDPTELSQAHTLLFENHQLKSTTKACCLAWWELWGGKQTLSALALLKGLTDQMGSLMTHDLDPQFLPLLWIEGVDARTRGDLNTPESDSSHNSSVAEDNNQNVEPDSSPYSAWIRPQMAYELYQEQKKQEDSN